MGLRSAIAIAEDKEKYRQCARLFGSTQIDPKAHAAWPAHMPFGIRYSLAVNDALYESLRIQALPAELHDLRRDFLRTRFQKLWRRAGNGFNCIERNLLDYTVFEGSVHFILVSRSDGRIFRGGIYQDWKRKFRWSDVLHPKAGQTNVPTELTLDSFKP